MLIVDGNGTVGTVYWLAMAIDLFGGDIYDPIFNDAGTSVKLAFQREVVVEGVIRYLDDEA